MYFSHEALIPLTFNVKCWRIFPASTGAARRSKAGGKKIGWYRSIALATISHVGMLDWTVNAFGRMKSKSLEIVMNWGCGQIAFTAARCPYQSLVRSWRLDLIMSLTFNGYFTSIKLISARTPDNAIAPRKTATRRSPSMLQSNWFPSYLSCSVWMKTIAWPIESTSLYRPRDIFPLFKHVRSMIVEQIYCISLVRGEKKKKKIDERERLGVRFHFIWPLQT